MPNPARVSHAEGDPAHDHAGIIFEFDAHADVITKLDDAGWTRFVFKPGVHPPDWHHKRGVEIAGVTRTPDMVLMRPENLLLPCFNEGVPLTNALMRETAFSQPLGARGAGPGSDTLYPISLQLYAVERLGMGHLANHLRAPCARH